MNRKKALREMVQLGVNSQASGNIVLAASLVLVLASAMALAIPQSFEVGTDREGYTLSQDVRLFVSGPPNTAFKVRILRADVLILTKKGETDSDGNWFYTYPPPSSGEYTAELTSSLNQDSVRFSVDDRSIPWGESSDDGVPWGDELDGDISWGQGISEEVSEEQPGGGGHEETFDWESKVVEPVIPWEQLPSNQTTINELGTTTLGPITADYLPWSDSESIKVSAGLELRTEKIHFGGYEKPSFRLSITDTFLSSSSSTSTLVHATVLDSSGDIAPLVPVIRELGGDEYSIEILGGRAAIAGEYKLVVYANEGEVEQTFSWGLVSLNIRKSTYHTNETAEFEIIVLDSQGRSVCGAEVNLYLIDPQGPTRTYSTWNKTIDSHPECGLYSASYTTINEGLHEILVLAEVDGENVSFETNFSVSDYFEFDILRDAKSKIDPTRADHFNVKINISSFTNFSDVEIREYIPLDFEVFNTDASVSVDGNSRVLHWDRALIGNKTSVIYSYRVPMVWPILYELGPIEISYGNETFREARPWYVAVDPTTVYTSFYDDSTCPGGVDYCNNTADLPSISVSGSTQWTHYYTHEYPGSDIMEWDLKAYVAKTGGGSASVVGRFYKGGSSVATCTVGTGAGEMYVTLWLCSTENLGQTVKDSTATGNLPPNPESVSGNSLTGTSYDIYIGGGSRTTIQAVAVWYNRSYSDIEPNTIADDPTTGTWFARSATSANINCSATDDVGVSSVTFQQDADGAGAYTNVYTDNDHSDGQWNWTYNPSANLGPCASGSIGTTGTCYLGCYATDTIGQNDPSPATWNIKIDGDGPTGTTAGISGVNEMTGWIKGTVNFTCSGATDSGSGVKANGYEYAYTLNDAGIGGWTKIAGCNTSSCNWDTSSLNDATTWIRCNSSDTVGNVGSDTAQYAGIDNSGPTSTLTKPEENGSINSDIYTVTASASDTGIGVDDVFFEYRQTPEASWYSACNDTDGPPYQCNWDLSILSDGGGYQVQVRANDSLGNMGGYDTNINITVDRIAPNLVSNAPTDSELILPSPYTLNASSSSDSLSGIANCTWEYSIAGAGSWTYIGADTVPASWTYPWSLPADNTYDVRLNCTDTVGNENSTIIQDIIIDTIDSPPTCIVVYPNGGENVSGVVTLQVTASEPDPSDIVETLAFNYSTDSGSTWNLIGTNNTQNLSTYTYIWDTTGIDSNTALIRCQATDTRGSKSYDDSARAFTIDNTEPTIIAQSVNQTLMAVNSYVCINATVTDNYAVHSVWAEIDRPGYDPVNVTLLDNGLGCDEIQGDDTYSKEYKSSYEGTYNWTYAYANDSAGNPKEELTSKTWVTSSAANMTVLMISPTSNLEINESGAFNQYTQTCNVSCDAGGLTCTGVYLYPQYYTGGGWVNIDTGTTDLTVNSDPYSCGNLPAGTGSCQYSFTITSGASSGGNSWNIRCEANSTIAPLSNSSLVTLTVNDPPSSGWTSPAPAEWIRGNYTLNASASTDIDGTIDNYLFEIDDNPGFTSPSTVYSGSNDNTILNTKTQTQCADESSSCYLRVNVTDDNGMTDIATIQVGIDNKPPTSSLVEPPANISINTDTHYVNASVSDPGSGVDTVFFEYRQNQTSSWYSICNDTDGYPYDCIWDFTSLPDSISYEVRVSANDSVGNLNGQDAHINITIDRQAPTIVLILPENRTNTSQTTIDLSFNATDNIEPTINCSVYIDGTLNKTNSTTESGTPTTFTIGGFSQGLHTWYINCSDTINNKPTFTRQFTVDYDEPSWSSQQQRFQGLDITVAHRGDPVNLSAVWSDNINLEYAWLETNETGTRRNKTGAYQSPQGLVGTDDTSYFIWENNSLDLGTNVAWRIHANDSARNINSTSTLTFQMWGWGELSSIKLNPSAIAPNGSTTIECRVIDNTTLAAIQGYTVYFYNSTHFLGSNSTESDGWAYMTYNHTGEGTEQLTCNITDNATLFYDASSAYQESDTLTIERGSETQKCEDILYNGGSLSGDCSNIDTIDDVYLNWSRVRDSTSENTYYIQIDTNTAQPRDLVTSINFTWMMSRVVNNYAPSYQNPTTGTISFSGASDITAATINESDNKYMVCTEASSGGFRYDFDDGRVNFYVQELDTEVTYSKLEIIAVARQYGVGTGDSLQFTLYDYTASAFNTNIFTIPDEQVNWKEYYYSTTTNVENYISSSGQIQIRMEDTLSANGEGESIWHIDHYVVIVHYDNPTTNNVYNYTIGWINQSNGDKIVGETLSMDSTDTNYSFLLTSDFLDAITVDGNMTGYLTVWRSGTPTQSATRENTFAIDYYSTHIKYDSSLAYYLNVSAINASNQIIENARIEIFNSSGTLMSSLTVGPGNPILYDILVLNKEYVIEMNAPLDLGPFNVTIVNLTLKDHTLIEPQIVENYPYSYPAPITNVTPLVALDDSDLSYNHIELSIPKAGITDINTILHCLDWDYDNAQCSSWELFNPSDYSMTENSTHIRFNVTEFDTFGGGAGATLPNLTEIRIYNVSNLPDPRVGGTLEYSGTNFTANMFTNKTYRVEFWVRNDGRTWNLKAEDVIYHEGLNSSWDVDHIWYNDGTNTNYTGGTWSGGRITWDASLGGQVNNGGWITFYYVANLTSNETEPLPVFFIVNDTSKNSGSTDWSVYNVTKVGGFLNATLNEPPIIPGKGNASSNGRYLVGQYKLFKFNATVQCLNGECWDTWGELRYNASSSEPDTSVSMTIGANPFYIVEGQNPASCGYLSNNDSCTITWTINATGDLQTLWAFDVLFTSQISKDNDTENVFVEIAKVLIIDLDFDNITFCNEQGSCEPLSIGNNGTLNNQGGYNISVNPNSNDLDGLYIRGTNLTAQSLPNIGSIKYGIGVTNISWNQGTNDYGNPSTVRLTHTYELVKSSVQSGQNVTIYFWIDLPPGQYAQRYVGTAYIMANASDT